MNRAFKGVWIPKEIWTNRELTLQEKSLITEIDSLDNDEGCFASNKYFAEFMNLSERQVKRIIQNLILKKWITSELIYKKDSNEIEKRILRVCRPPYPEKEVVTNMTPPLVTNVVKGSDKNGLDNNINNNINNNEQNSLLDHFEKIWEMYPNKKGKAKALEYYFQWIKGRKISGITKRLTDKQMWYAVFDYAKECEANKIEQKYIKHGDTFFNKAILDYIRS